MATDKKISSLYNGSYSKQKKPGGYNVPKFDYKDGKLRKLYDELMSRKDFTFDLNGNVLYNQLKDVHVKQGQLAMQDTIGQASAMTGGYGNSYAVSAGQQAYQQSLDSLNEKVPEIYQLALEQYQLEGQNLMDKYGIAANERDFAYGQYMDDRDFDYQKHRDSVADSQWQEEYDYRAERDKVADEQWQKEFDYTEERDKIADEQWQKEFDERRRQWTEEQKLAFKKFAEEIRQFNLQYKLSEREFEEMCRQWAKEYGLDERKLAEDIRQFNLSYEQDVRALDEEIRHNAATETKYSQTYSAPIDDEVIDEDDGEGDDYLFGFPGSEENGDWSAADEERIQQVENDIDNLMSEGRMTDDDSIRKYLNELMEDGGISLAQYQYLKAQYGF